MSSLSLMLLLMESSTADSITATPLPKTNRDGSEHSCITSEKVEFGFKVCSSPSSPSPTKGKVGAEPGSSPCSFNPSLKVRQSRDGLNLKKLETSPEPPSPPF